MVRAGYRDLLAFFRNDQGGGTVFGLLWFALLVGICGLAVDITNGFRSRTMLQATADAAALAGAIDLPNNADIVTTAAAYSVTNMGAEVNGLVLKTEDVTVGKWDDATRSLDPTSLTPDAVMVRVFQSEENSNPLPVNFLRIIGLQSWNVTAQAVAQRFIPECLRDGLVAREIVDISSNNDFVNQICVHGQQGVHMQNHNYYEAGVHVSMPNPDTQLVIPAQGMTSNPGLPEALREDILDPRMVNHVDEIMAQMLARDAEVLPEYINPALPVIDVDEKYKFAGYLENRIYRVLCAPNKQVSVPNNKVLTNIVVISQCNINVGSGAQLSNVVLGSTALGNGSKPLENANISFSANVDLGAIDNCVPGGGVQLFSSASIHFSSSMRINGLQAVAAGDVELGARDNGINGISVQTGGTITLTSNNAFGLCSGGAPDLFTVPYYRLVL